MDEHGAGLRMAPRSFDRAPGSARARAWGGGRRVPGGACQRTLGGKLRHARLRSRENAPGARRFPRLQGDLVLRNASPERSEADDGFGDRGMELPPLE